jgi:hypothetical protein
MLIYVAGPYSGDVDRNIDRARVAAARLWDAGHTVICPHANTARFEGLCQTTTYEDFMRGDLTMLAVCDAIFMLKGWADSPGANTEHAFAQSHGLTIFYESDDSPPELHTTEVRCPNQAVQFRILLGKMYRTHLRKNRDYCLAPGTKVLTGNLLWVPIETLSPGETIVGFDENVQHPTQFRRMYRPSVVESTNQVRLPSYKIVLENGDVLVASSEHPWLIRHGLTSVWCTTENLRPGLSCLVKALDVWEPTHDYESGYLAAALDGEGWLSQAAPSGKNKHKHGKGFALGFAQNDNAMLATFCAMLDRRAIPYRLKYYRPNLVQVIFAKPRRTAIRLLGEVRPRRLLEKLDLNIGMVDLRERVKIVDKEPLGERELISIQTSTRTFLANGYATHNSPANILLTGSAGNATRLWDKVARLVNLTGFKLDVEQGEFSPANAMILELLARTVMLLRGLGFRFKPGAISWRGAIVPDNESIEDTLMDNAVYSLIMFLLRQGHWGN